MRVRRLEVTNWKSFASTGPIELDQINVLVGHNNHGKSALIQAVHLMQAGAELDFKDKRIGAPFICVECDLEAVNFNRHFRPVSPEDSDDMPDATTARWSRRLGLSGDRRSLDMAMPLLQWGDNQSKSVLPISNDEPANFIYPYLAQRKVSGYDYAVDRSKANAVLGTLQNMAARITKLLSVGDTRNNEYSELCDRILGFRVNALPSEHGLMPGIMVGKHDSIYITDMGEGVPNIVGLIINLCMAQDNLLLIEELENDIHPKGLKALLDVIVEKSANNQFIVSTHSNVVVRHLGSAPRNQLFVVRMSILDEGLPTSTVESVDPTPTDRISVLRELGYELYDFDLWDGWLILEESTAERVIRDFLIPKFAPKLSRVRTVAAGGTSKAEPTFEDFRRLFVFAHLEETYRGRAWVVLDGDKSGRDAVGRLRNKYQTDWLADHFKNWSEATFEDYYPERFRKEVQSVREMSHGQAKQDAKKALVESVIRWCDEEPNAAQTAFAESAGEVIDLLMGIERQLFGANPALSGQ